ncbi:HsdM [Ectopseudomonas oleovorans]|uniref:HsdM n=1 Tax=Ectopseudomonas oleovorans TaxID=301 RepID=A0A379K544_ECTOL|nr:SNF2-related protein [Pseudomonas oleovorans]SUD59820.1 HsdM [Pseudomonas oleovorans]
MRFFFDDVASMGAPALLARLRLVSELGRTRKELLGLAQGATAIMQRLGLIKRANQIRAELGALAAEVPGASLRLNEEPPQVLAAPRAKTAHLYQFHEKRTKGQRQKANDAAIVLLNKVGLGELRREDLTETDRAVLAGYTGNGGALIGADGKKGSAYEYYTPKPIAEGIWGALGELGFAGGKVLDPCAGVGIFGATAPLSAAVDAVELDTTSGGINALVNDGASYSTTISPFERVAAATPDEIYDAVVSNVPFGTLAARGGNQKHDPKYQRETLEAYFILRSLDKLKPGGLAAFLVPPRCTSGKDGSDAKLRQRASLKAEFIGAYRLPNKVFGAASADTITDVIFFRKYSRQAAEKIEELKEQDPAKLAEAKVLWGEYLEGKYFSGEGRRFVLGEFTPKDPSKFRDVDKVSNPASIPDIAKMLRRLPKSRVDWGLLEAVETQPIIYAEGDTITQAGQTLQLQAGQWVPLKATGSDTQGAELLGHFKDAYSAFEQDAGYSDALTLMQYMKQTSQSLDIPGWLASTMAELDKLGSAEDRARAWPAVLVGLSVSQVLDEVGRDSGTDFSADYARLSSAMQRHAATARRIKGLGGSARTALGELANHYNRKTGYSALWRGDVQSAPTIQVTAQQGFEGLLYENKSNWATLEQAKTLFGADFDPFERDDWCVSADGTQISRADDYFVGNYGEFCQRIDGEMAAAPNERVRDKLLRQKAIASERIDKVDVSKITFNLFSPYVTLEEKAEFLRRFVHPSAVVVFNDKTSEPEIDFDIPGSKLTDREKLIRRLGAYLKNGTLTLGGVKLSMKDADAIKELRAIINTANEQFNGWARGNVSVLDRLQAQTSDPARLRFTQAEDESPLPIPGMNPALTLHGYQNAEVRRRSRDFSGINGFDVGLGKTFTALALVQYVQSIGVKKKTAIVVPNSVLSNWRNEAQRAYTGTDDCLFIGLREDGKGGAVVSSSNYDEDLNRVLENRHSKIFMTMEAFERIRLKDGSIADYEQFMRSADASFAESEDKKADERAKGKAKTILSILGSKAGAAPFLEDMGIDSLVVDEAHVFKNSAATVDFKGGKYLSLSPASKRGLDAQAKAWLIRGGSPRGDGVLLLTATPITNSPLEIYSMLSLAAGHGRVNDMFAGTSGADGFMNAVCNIVNEDDESLDGQARAINVFQGLNNAEMLRGSLGQVATIKSAKDVGSQISVPDAPERATRINLPEATVRQLEQYKLAYRYAADAIAERSDNRGDAAAFDSVAARFGEPMELIGHPFNLINKMTMLIADPDLDQRVSRFIIAEGQQDAAQKLVEAWNAKKFTEDRPRPGPNATEDEAVSRKALYDSDKELVGYLFKMPVKAWVAGATITIDSISADMQERFEEMAEKAGVALDVSVPPKLAALLENVQIEAATPRGIDENGDKIPYAKQIIFCDLLGMHNKIKRLIAKRAGVPASAIAIITGQRNNAPDEIMEVQNGFNAPGEANKYRVIIANEKAEVGINLQKGTQAIHHLTIGWTPDSLTQRNGRGVRQGNKTQAVTIYHYDADGTFDTAKRSLVNSKADWIGSLMSKDGGDSVAITGGMSREQMEVLIDAVGDADAVTRIQEAMAAKEAQSRATSNRDRQRINLDTIAKQNEFLSDNAKAEGWIARKVGALMAAMAQTQQTRSRLSNPKASESARAKNQALLAEQEVRERGIERLIEEAATFRPAAYDHQTRTIKPAEGAEPLAPRDVVLRFLSQAKRGENRVNDLVDALRAGRLGYGAVHIEVNPDAELVNDWEAEVSMATSMRDQAVATYQKQAGQAGALPSGVAEAFSRGEGVMIGDVPVIAGCFIAQEGVDLSHTLLAVGAAGLMPGRMSARGIWRGTEQSVPLAAAVPTGRVIYPGSAAYEDCLTTAAAYEDAEERAGRTSTIFTEACPDVATRRETEALALYLVRGHHLPAPHFPIVIEPSSATEGTALLPRIVEAQSKVIKRWEGLRFAVSSSLEVEPASGILRHEALRDYAIAHSLQAKAADFGVSGRYYLELMIRPLIQSPGFDEALAGSDADAIEQAVAAHVRSVAPWFDFAGDETAFLTPGQRARASRAVLAAGGEPAVPALASSGAPGDLVNVTGKTMDWKDRIKSYALRDGQKAKWNGRRECWSMRRAAWEKLIADFPRAAEDLRLLN